MQALALNGIAFKGQPLLVQASMAEKNRLAQAAKNVAAASAMIGSSQSATLAVSELHPNVSRHDFSEVFSPFGELEHISMPVDAASGAGLGSGTVVFKRAEDAKSAQDAINGLELAGKKIVVQLVKDVPNLPVPLPASLPNSLPNVTPGLDAMSAVVHHSMPGAVQARGLNSLASRCVLMANMFDPNGDDEKNDKYFFEDLREDVTEEISKHGEVLKCVVLPQTAGHVKAVFATQDAADRCVAALHRRTHLACLSHTIPFHTATCVRPYLTLLGIALRPPFLACVC